MNSITILATIIRILDETLDLVEDQEHKIHDFIDMSDDSVCVDPEMMEAQQIADAIWKIRNILNSMSRRATRTAQVCRMCGTGFHWEEEVAYCVCCEENYGELIL